MSACAYADMIYLQRPISKRIRMDIGHRAKQFAPFAALKGFEESVKKKEVIYEKRKINMSDSNQEDDSRNHVAVFVVKTDTAIFLCCYLKCRKKCDN